MIPPRDQALLRQRLAEELTSRVRIDFFTQRPSPIIIPGRQECPYCENVGELMDDLAALSPRIKLTRHEFSASARAAADLGVGRVPAIVMRGPTNRPIRYFGMPTGAEFPTFIETLIETSKGGGGLDEPVKRQLKKLRDEVSLKVLLTPSCTNSPKVARAAFRLGLQSTRVKTEVIEAIEFPALAREYRLRATPTVIINDDLAFVGSMDEAMLVDCLLRVVEQKSPRDDLKLGPSTPFGKTQPGEEERIGPSGLIIPR